MASTIITKNSSTASAVPVVGDLTKGELAVNVTDKKIYTKDNSAAVVKLVGSLGNQEANAVAITGGSIAGITDLAVADGGTGSSTAANARTNLGAAASGANSDITSLSGLTTALSVAQGGTGITSFGSGVATFLGTPSSANLLAAVTDETGTGALVFANTPTLVSPILGTPTSGNFSSGSFTWPTFNQNTTGTAAGLSATLAIASGGTGQTTANAAFNALAPSQTSASGKYLKSDGTNTSWDALDISTADITGTLPVANGGTGVTSSTGTGSVVLSNSPTLVTPILGTPQSGNFSTGTFTWPTFNQNTTGTAAGLSATLATTSGGTGLTSFTSGGVVYASSTSALATGSALTFDGTSVARLTSASGPQYGFSDATTIFGTIGSQLAITGAGAIDTFVVSSTNGKPLSVRAPSGQYITFDLATSEQMRLTSTGLGIGTSSPSVKLDVNGTNGIGRFNSSDANGAYVTFANNGTAKGYIGSAIQIVTSGSANDFAIQAVNNFVFATGGAAETARFPATGGFQSKTTISVGDATPSSSGAGITFPATQSASSDANTLDDYEEGTWEPVITGAISNPSVTYSVQNGFYCKIGRTIIAQGRVATSAWSGGSGELRVSLPFVANSGSGFRASGSCSYILNITNGGSAFVPQVGENTNYMIFYKYTDADQFDTEVPANANTSGTAQINFSLVYQF